MDTALTQAAISIGRLDGLARSSLSQDAWMITSGLAGIRHVLALDGVLLDQRQLIDGLCGLLHSDFIQDLDKAAAGRLIAVALDELPLPSTLLTLFRVQKHRVPLLAALDQAARLRRAQLSHNPAPVPDELLEGLEATVGHLAVELVPLQHIPHDNAVLAAAAIGCAVPAALKQSGVTSRPFPCLTAVSPGAWLAGSHEQRTARLYETLAFQAEEALALYEAIASMQARWKVDLGKVSNSDRAALLFALLLALPVVSRIMLAAVLQSTPRGAEQATVRWVRGGVFEWIRHRKEKILRRRHELSHAGLGIGVEEGHSESFAKAAADADAALQELDGLLEQKVIGPIKRDSLSSENPR